MPLTVRTNGSAGSNIITAAWFNDYYNLLTGVMQDQEVTIKNDLNILAIGTAPSAAMTAALAAGTNMGIGLYVYTYTYANADGETVGGPTTSITTTTGNQKVNLSSVTVGPTGTTQRNIYRTVVGGGIYYKFVGSINDNTTTTFTDTVADGSLGASISVYSTFGGINLKDAAGVVRAQLSNDGPFISNVNPTTINGSVSGTAKLYLPIWGNSLKLGILTLAGYQNASNANFNFPPNTTLARGLYVLGNLGSTTPAFSWMLNGSSGVSSSVITGLATGGGSGGTVTAFHQNSIGTIISSVNGVQVGSNSGITSDSALFFIGV